MDKNIVVDIRLINPRVLKCMTWFDMPVIYLVIRLTRDLCVFHHTDIVVCFCICACASFSMCVSVFVCVHPEKVLECAILCLSYIYFTTNICSSIISSLVLLSSSSPTDINSMPLHVYCVYSVRSCECECDCMYLCLIYSIK